MNTTAINGEEYKFDFHQTHNGTRLAVWKWNTATRDLEKVSDYLYPLQTDFEILCSWASEHLGESVEGETLAEALGVEMRTSEDVECMKCHTWDYYFSEDMVHGTDALPKAAEALGLGYWDYVCMNCYLDTLALVGGTE